MADIPDYDPTKDDTGAAGGARGGDDDTQDYNLPGGPTDSPEEQRRKWYQRGARPKDKTNIAINHFLTTMKTFLCQNFLTKRTDCSPLQRTLIKLLSLREHLQDEL